jgi:hypothetical protein
MEKEIIVKVYDGDNVDLYRIKLENKETLELYTFLAKLSDEN